MATGYLQYLVSALFGFVYTWAADLGGTYGKRASRLAVVALIGAGLTALGFAISGDAWGWLLLAAFAVMLAGDLAIALGWHRFAAGQILSSWFIIALALGVGFHHQPHVASFTWAQVLAWSGGAVLWIAATFIDWLIHGRGSRPQPVAELLSDTSRHKLTPPLLAYAVVFPCCTAFFSKPEVPQRSGGR